MVPYVGEEGRGAELIRVHEIGVTVSWQGSTSFGDLMERGRRSHESGDAYGGGEFGKSGGSKSVELHEQLRLVLRQRCQHLRNTPRSSFELRVGGGGGAERPQLGGGLEDGGVRSHERIFEYLDSPGTYSG